MMEHPFAYQAGDAGVTQNSQEELINLYAEIETSGKSKLVRRQRPGLRTAALISNIKRGIEEFSHGTYLVVRDVFYKFDGTTLTELGTMNTNVGEVTIITNDIDDVFVSDGVEGYHYVAATGVFGAVVTPSEVGTLAFQGGYGIYSHPDEDQFYISGLNNFASWNALDFATAESDSDKTVRVFVDHGELWIFGEKTIDIFRNSGAADFPFTYNTSAQRGCLAAYSVAAEDNSLFWLGNDEIVYRAVGYRPVRVSTHAIEEWISGAPNKSEGRAFTYTARGHKFYVLTFPDYGTRQFNIATNFWNVCRSWGEDDWKIIGGAGRQVTYYLTPSGIVTLDSTLNTDQGAIMERGGTSAPVFNGGSRMTFSAFWLDVEVGRVAATSAEPQIALQVSRNGEDFGNIRQRGMGLTGDYSRRVVWRGLGQAREFSLKLSCTDDVGLTIMSAFADIA